MDVTTPGATLDTTLDVQQQLQHSREPSDPVTMDVDNNDGDEEEQDEDQEEEDQDDDDDEHPMVIDEGPVDINNNDIGLYEYHVNIM